MLHSSVFCVKQVKRICKNCLSPCIFMENNEKTVDSPSPLLYNKVA